MLLKGLEDDEVEVVVCLRLECEEAEVNVGTSDEGVDLCGRRSGGYRDVCQTLAAQAKRHLHTAAQTRYI